jgi:actin-related protein 8
MPTMKPEGKDFEYKMFSPLRHGLLNTQDYNSIQACMNDMQTIWTYAIEKELGIPAAEFNHYNVVLVIPDKFNPLQVEEMVRMVLCDMQFKGILLHQVRKQP